MHRPGAAQRRALVENAAAAVTSQTWASGSGRKPPIGRTTILAGPDEKAFEISSLRFSWPGRRKAVLSIDHLELARGERLFLRGPSGSGKSTLLSALAGVIDIGDGQVRVSGRDIGKLKGSERDQFRGDKIGMIFQLFNLIPWLSPLENVLLPCRFSRKPQLFIRAEKTSRLMGNA